MGLRGPAKQSPEEQARRGNPSKRKIEKPEDPVAVGQEDLWRVPAKPPWLTEKGAEIWDETVPILLPYRLLGPMDGPMLGRYCESLSKAIENDTYIEKNGVFLKKTGGGKVRRPEVKLAEEAWKRVDKYGAYFGLSPRARQQMNIQLKQPKSKVDVATERKNRILGKG